MSVSSLFKFNKLNEAGVHKGEMIAETFDILLNDLRKWCPEGREFALVKTKLEEASFFAKKAMSQDTENQL